MPSLEQYSAFIETVERGSLTAAARHSNRSLQSVSRALAALEKELGVELIHRTTRRLQPSAAGLVFYERVKTALRDIEAASAEASLESSRIGGLFRIGGPVLFARNYVAPAAAAFLQRFPDLDIDLIFEDAFSDLIWERIDISIRIGDLAASSLKSRRIAQLRRVAIASPQYLARHGMPRTPADLAKHRCVIRTIGVEGDSWPFTVDGAEIRVPVRGTLRCNDAASANMAIVHGAGIGLAPLWQVRSDIDQGRLELILSSFEPPLLPVHAVWPGNIKTPARTRLFTDLLVQRMAGERV